MKIIKEYSKFIGGEKIEGGKSSGLDLFDIAKKHLSNPEFKRFKNMEMLYVFLLKELQIGSSVESEHTPDESIAREIAMDHLDEDPYYYRKLKKAGL